MLIGRSTVLFKKTLGTNLYPREHQTPEGPFSFSPISARYLAQNTLMLLQFCPYKNVYVVTFFAENYDHAFIAQRELIGEPFLRFGLKITRSIMKGKGY